MTDFKDKILKELHDGDVRMTPRIYFTLQLGAFVALLAGILIVTVFIFNFITFSIRISGQQELLGFGPRGISAFLFFFPWPLLFLDIALVALLQWLMRHFRAGYKTPVLYLLFSMLAGAALLGWALDKTEVNDRFFERPDRLPPPFGSVYRGAHHGFARGSGVCRCTIVAIGDDTITVLDNRDATNTITVFLPPDTMGATTSLNIGDMIFIAGEESGDEIHAFGIRKVHEHRFNFEGMTYTTYEISLPAQP